MHDTASIFERYEAIRHRLPGARFLSPTVEIDSLVEISDEVDAFVFDAFGVLNVGETPIPGAADRVEQLRAAGHRIRILSNAASYNHAAATEKFRKLGIAISQEEIVTSRDAAIADLEPLLWGCIAAPSDDLSDIPAEVIRLQCNPEDYDRADAILFLSSEAWTHERQALLETSLRTRPRRVVIANADLVAPRDTGFSLEPGHFGHFLADAGLSELSFFGKPFPEVYDMIEASMPGIPPERIAMCGDTLHTDILGAAARGWRTVLVTRDGLFSGADTRSYCERSAIIPSWRLARI